MESWRKWLSGIKLRALGEKELETASLSNSKSVVVKGRKKMVMDGRESETKNSFSSYSKNYDNMSACLQE